MPDPAPESSSRRAVILDGCAANDALGEAVRDALASQLEARGHAVESLTLRDMSIAPCIGCFGCWTKTPGECVTDDDGRRVARSLAEAELFCAVTPVTFGGHSYELKKALDRTLPNALPFFHRVRGEIHHPGRYDGENRGLLFVGLLPSPDEEGEAIFRALTDRNALESDDAPHATVFIYRHQDEATGRQALRDGVERLEART